MIVAAFGRNRTRLTGRLVFISGAFDLSHREREAVNHFVEIKALEPVHRL